MAPVDPKGWRYDAFVGIGSVQLQPIRFVRVVFGDGVFTLSGKETEAMSEKKTWDRSQDYEKFQSSEKAKKDRAARNKKRRELLREGRVKKGDGKDIDHKNGNPRIILPAISGLSASPLTGRRNESHG